MCKTGMAAPENYSAHEWAGVTPDIMAVAKALAAAFRSALASQTEEALRA